MFVKNPITAVRIIKDHRPRVSGTDITILVVSAMFLVLNTASWVLTGNAGNGFVAGLLAVAFVLNLLLISGRILYGVSIDMLGATDDPGENLRLDDQWWANCESRYGVGLRSRS